jgi:hypothetical protein
MQKRIFFGHQSVGANIIDGLKDIINGEGSLKVIESRNPHDSREPCLYHSRIGKNQDPLSKINDFISLMDSGFGNNVDIACFKFCYIDIQHTTDVHQLFDTYHNAMDSLSRKYHKTQFLHITVPLRTIEYGARNIFNKLLGRKSIAILNNQRRQIFNKLMIQQYNKSGFIFDLARSESTHPNGTSCKISYDGTTVYSLVPQYTDDGGHLNSYGRYFVATRFLESLEHLP